MRYPAQRSIDLQNCLPAQQGSAGLPYFISSKMISDAVDKWEKARGLNIDAATWHAVHRKEAEVRKAKKEKEAREAREAKEAQKLELRKQRKEAKTLQRLAVKESAVRKPLSEDQKQKEKQRKAEYRKNNADKIREEKRLAAQKRRAGMTAEERKLESQKIQEYNRLRRLRQNGSQ